MSPDSWPAMMKTPLAAAYTGQSQDTLKRASRITEPGSFPPPLKAKRQGKAENSALQFRRVDLDEWLAMFPDA